MLDEAESESQSFLTASFSTANIPAHVQQQQSGVPPISPATSNVNQASMPPPDATARAGQVPPMPTQFDPFDPMLDADPFGLSASMHFPTPYTFDNR
jgi:hypothetical protein